MAYGNHIIGTYALDQNLEVFPMLTHTGSPNDKAHGYPAAFPVIHSPLSIADQGEEILYFFCISYHERNYGYNLHVYAKSMIYAYKMLLQNTNIFDIGQVRFFIDNRCRDIVMPYLRAANIYSLAVFFSSDKPMNYAAYIPCFFHEVTEPFKYRFYSDLDIWWANMSDKPAFDFGQLIEKWDSLESGIFGQRVPKTKEQTHVDFYKRYLKDEAQLAQLREIMRGKFGEESFATEAGMSGTRNAMRVGSELDTLKSYHDKYGDLLLDDEAFWAFFLLDTGCTVNDIGADIEGGGPTKSEMERWDQGPMIINVGTYAFEHFHREKYEGFQKLYEHFKTES